MNKTNPSPVPPLQTEINMPLVTSARKPPRTAETRLDEEADRFALASRFSGAADEVVVVDERSALSPSQAVEDRLVALLRDASLPVSHLQIRGLVRGRRDDSRD